jgi:hypothetical protein
VVVDPPPVVATLAATGVTGTAATVNGSVNPQGAPARAWFEWGTSPALAGAASTAEQQLAPGSTAQSVSAALTGLQPNTTYYFRVVGSSDGGTARGEIRSFTTAAPPVPRTVGSTATGTTAVLQGAANPQGTAGEGWFEWSTSPTLAGAQSTPRTALPAVRTDVAFDAELANLFFGTTYYFRAVASNAAGTTRGEIQTFRTSAPPVVAGTGSDWNYSPADTAWLVDFFGLVTPNGAATQAWFQWSASSTFANAVNTARVNVGSSFNSSPYTVRTRIPDCGPWYYRAVAQNANGITYGALRQTYCEGEEFIPVGSDTGSGGGNDR